MLAIIVLSGVCSAALAHTVESGKNSHPKTQDALKAVVMGVFSDGSLDISEIEPMSILDMLHVHSDGMLNFSHNQVSLNRGWLELSKRENACMFNKLKTPEREKVAYYSQYPITLYPPLRLIVLKQQRHLFPEVIDLDTLKDWQLGLIGVSASRAYGKVIDEKIALSDMPFFKREGGDSSRKLIDMLVKGRVNAVIEYSDFAASYVEDNDLPQQVSSIAIKQVNQASAGYFVCSKTEYGLKLIKQVDAAMSRKAFQQEFFDIHKRFASVDDTAVLEKALEFYF
ncbi:hypothetical protein G3R49_04295 [Shewanella sp. WXL01]|uniref:Transporter substrate-binding domain-containing protein n=1 Tax=Shewanella maritima TaxID=2520507 RepID=A0A411PF12_9GAMM|nr:MULTISPECIES: hypothetical protein [Shewanella]NKF49791.1 hypothetical protein [Shewanella sp. WXL01]QBF82133.1 hypothetical protein EXU30_05005 [Shewanella maritima]